MRFHVFSGIVESQAQIKIFRARAEVFELVVERPQGFDDIHLGDSIATNGVCLTVEAFDPQHIQFALAGETLKVTGWDKTLRPGLSVNLERSLRFGDRIHGHLVQGHVDAIGEVVDFNKSSESALLSVRLPKNLLPFVWTKGSLTLNGVSLTINNIVGDVVSFCLIPETLKRTNLNSLIKGDYLTVEADSLARYYNRMRELGLEHNT
jgi:riboflavin synthase